jgi:hypothetical protein
MSELIEHDTGKVAPKRQIGRSRKGIPNKATTNARAAIGEFVDNNSRRLQRLLDKIERTEGPLAAWKCIMDLVEYHVPKLARLEHVGDKGGPIQMTVTKDDEAV